MAGVDVSRPNPRNDALLMEAAVTMPAPSIIVAALAAANAFLRSIGSPPNDVPGKCRHFRASSQAGGPIFAEPLPDPYSIATADHDHGCQLVVLPERVVHHHLPHDPPPRAQTHANAHDLPLH